MLDKRPFSIGTSDINWERKYLCLYTIFEYAIMDNCI